jgi:hypothetical protein
MPPEVSGALLVDWCGLPRTEPSNLCRSPPGTTTPSLSRRMGSGWLSLEASAAIMTSGSGTWPAARCFPSLRDPNEDGAPIWAPDGADSHSATEYRYGGPPSSGSSTSAPADLRLEADSGREFSAPTGWSQDGGLLFFESRLTGVGPAAMGKDISVLDLATGKRRLWLQTADDDRSAVPSPDGHLVAYVSEESGQTEVYLRAASGTGAPLAVVERRWARGRIGQGAGARSTSAKAIGFSSSKSRARWRLLSCRCRRPHFNCQPHW